jgi:hypothetical protein
MLEQAIYALQSSLFHASSRFVKTNTASRESGRHYVLVSQHVKVGVF